MQVYSGCHPLPESTSPMSIAVTPFSSSTGRVRLLTYLQLPSSAILTVSSIL